MKKALVFAGQGTHHKGMSMNLLTKDSVVELWSKIKERMMLSYGINLQEIIQENPSRIHVNANALNMERLRQNTRQVSEMTHQANSRTLTIAHQDGVLSYSYLAQPCVLAAEMIALEYLKCNGTLASDLSDVNLVAGHSLGEFSALTALGIFKPEDAVELVYKRGLLMEDAFHNVHRGSLGMYVCNPQRAMLHEADKNVADDTFFVFVELIAQKLCKTTSFLEIVNFNVHHEQYVVAGDHVALAVLGKCLDPQFRANCKSSNVVEVVNTAFECVKLDKPDGVTDTPNSSKHADFVSSSTRRYGPRSVFRRFMRGPDDGYTPALEELSHLTLQGDGRSGLKRRSWYLPLKLEIPYHTSRLRRCMDLFLPLIQSSLPEEAELRRLLRLPTSDKELWVSNPDNGVSIGDSIYHNSENQIHWVTNLTGSVFAPYNNAFITRAVETISAPNIGEVPHKGTYSSNKILECFSQGLQNKCVGDICAAILAAQVAHPVYWTDVMDEIVVHHNCHEILEISPQSVVANMFKRTTFKRVVDNGTLIINVNATCFPPKDGNNVTMKSSLHRE